MEVVEKETSGAIGEVTDPVCRNLKENVHSSSSVSVKDEEKTPTRLNRFCADFAPTARESRIVFSYVQCTHH
jgi:hypothetical protein